MVPISQIMGRTANMMFWFAFGLNYARMHGITDSYFPQDPEWFAESKDYIKALFSEGIGAVDKVGIHVRRGDYLDPNRIQYALPMEYYEKAMEMLFPNEKFIVCSDDITWCEQEPTFKDCEFSHGDEIEDMNLLASCTKGVIISNGSFGFWGGYLNPHHCTIVAPLKWDKDNKVFPLPDNWTVI